MSALPRPDVAGPVKVLNDALHDLHHRAGWPSLRALARETGVSHTTVSKAFSAPGVPSWGTVELLVEALGGDSAAFHGLWLTASDPAAARSPIEPPRMAGRSKELAAIRAHMQTGAGLILLTGEAGMGKTKVVTAAIQTSDRFVGIGHCLPLSIHVPFMPIADVLRAVHGADDGRWLDEALDPTPAYVRASLSGLLPELVEDGSGASVPDDFSRQRLLAALFTCFTRLHSMKGLALVVEDLHWADTATLDVLEHLLVKAVDLPIVGTWRLDDPQTGGPQDEWWRRVTRLSNVKTIELDPLTREETGDQCRLLGVGLQPEGIDAIHRRSQGQPLFTEQLAAQAGSETDLPTALTDLLDRRLHDLDDTAHVVTRALGVADRGLPLPVLAAVTNEDEDALLHTLRELARRHLLAPTDSATDVQLKHPLLAEAVRRRLVAGEAAGVHRRIAIVLGRDVDCDAAEVAEHWRGAGDQEEELTWRITAARAASGRWASHQEADFWLRALELWPGSRTTAGDPPLTRAEAYLAAIDALMHSLQFDRGLAMSNRAALEFPAPEPTVQAEFLRRAALFRAEREGPKVGLELIDEAIDILSRLPAGHALMQAMGRKHQLLLKSGAYAEAHLLAKDTAAAAEAVGDQQTLRVMLGRLAWHEALSGRLDQATEMMTRALSLLPSDQDPTGDIWLAVIWTDALLVLGAPSQEVEAAGTHALDLAHKEQIEDFGPVLVRYNILSALIHDGRLAEARALLGSDADGEVDFDRAPYFYARALLEALSGRLDEATALTDKLLRDGPSMDADLEFDFTVATIDLWSKRPAQAWTRTRNALASLPDAVPAPLLLPTLVLAARAAADLAADDQSQAAAAAAELSELAARARLSTGPEQGWAIADALRRTWSAELARLESNDSPRHWLEAASEFDRLDRHHDAAYCRWRAAEAALRHGQGTASSRLLTMAARDARGHEPLLAAIEQSSTTGSSRSSGH